MRMCKMYFPYTKSDSPGANNMSSLCFFERYRRMLHLLCDGEKQGPVREIIWLIFSRSPKSPQGLVLVAQDCWCHAVHWEGCARRINIWVCVSGESEMTLSLSVVFGVVASSEGPAQWHRVTRAMTWTHTHILSLSLSLHSVGLPRPSPRITHTLTDSPVS